MSRRMLRHQPPSSRRPAPGTLPRRARVGRRGRGAERRLGVRGTGRCGNESRLHKNQSSTHSNVTTHPVDRGGGHHLYFCVSATGGLFVCSQASHRGWWGRVCVAVFFLWPRAHAHTVCVCMCVGRVCVRAPTGWRERAKQKREKKRRLKCRTTKNAAVAALSHSHRRTRMTLPVVVLDNGAATVRIGLATDAEPR